MAIFRKIRDIISASINDLLEKMEDPERAVNQIIREMEQSIVTLRREAASAIASHRMLLRKLEKAEAERDEWAGNAALAARQERDDLARKALERKHRAEALVKTLKNQTTESGKLVGRLKDELRRVEDKVQEARSKRSTLITKKRLSQYRRDLARNAENMRKASPERASFSDVIDGFDRLEEKIEREIAEVEAGQELDDEMRSVSVEEQFDHMKRDRALDDELKALKKRTKK